MNSTKTIRILTIVTALGLVSGCSQDDAPGATAGGAAGGSESSSGEGNTIGNSVQTGKIAADGFYFLFEDNDHNVFDDKGNYTQKEVSITVYADDINDLELVNGWTVSFKTEWGTFLNDKDSCVLEGGSCSVTWRSGSPATAPGSCYVAFTAWAKGEEYFEDANDNGLFDSNELYIDVEEPFLNIDESFGPGVVPGTIVQTFTPNVLTAELLTELIDVRDFNGRSGLDEAHDPGNELYDGSFCAPDNGSRCSGMNTVTVSYNASLRIQDPFTDSDDIDGDGDTTDEINYCGPNPY